MAGGGGLSLSVSLEVAEREGRQKEEEGTQTEEAGPYQGESQPVVV